MSTTFWAFMAGVALMGIVLCAPVQSSKISAEQECGTYANALLLIQLMLTSAEDSVKESPLLPQHVREIASEALTRGRDIRG